MVYPPVVPGGFAPPGMLLCLWFLPEIVKKKDSVVIFTQFSFPANKMILIMNPASVGSEIRKE